jgi:RHS repeat-associated protein
MRESADKTSTRGVLRHQKLLGHRYYDASTGRFLSRDSAKDGRNWYVYCENNPLGKVDPSGHIPAVAAGLLILPGFRKWGLVLT